MKVVEGKAIYEGPNADKYTIDLSGQISDVAIGALARMVDRSIDTVHYAKVLETTRDETLPWYDALQLASRQGIDLTQEEVDAVRDDLIAQHPPFEDDIRTYFDKYINIYYGQGQWAAAAGA